MKKRTIIMAVLLVFCAGIALTVLFEVGLAYSNRTEFCVSCHSMQVSYDEYRQSVHYRNSSGIVASCADCHVPKPFIPKMVAKVTALRDLYHEFTGKIDTKEKYEAHREEMAARVLDYMRDNDSRECRSCHVFSQMELEKQGETAREEHAMLADNEITCVDCHTCVAHKQPKP